MAEIDLERLAGQRLHRLPQPQAPPTLLPRVMEAVAHSRLRPARPASWLSWAPAWQIASALALIAIVAGLLALQPFAAHTVAALGDTTVGSALARAAEAGREIAATAGAVATVVRLALVPAAVVLLVLIAIMGAACAIFAAALKTVAWEGTSR